jgi:1-deoxy-D-xylulose-5-phosphate synthase
MIVMAPKDENELRHMLKTAVECGNPVALRYPRGKGVGAKLDRELKTIKIGKGEILRKGSALAVVAIGSTVYPSLDAAQKLAAQGISVEVINARFVKPLDSALLLKAASSFKKIIIVEENVLQGGFGSAVLEFFAEKGVKGVQVKRLGIPDEFVEHATQAQLRHKYGLDEEGIVRAVKQMIK